jgi:hypothetical protein
MTHSQEETTITHLDNFINIKQPQKHLIEISFCDEKYTDVELEFNHEYRVINVDEKEEVFPRHNVITITTLCDYDIEFFDEDIGEWDVICHLENKLKIHVEE